MSGDQGIVSSIFPNRDFRERCVPKYCTILFNSAVPCPTRFFWHRIRTFQIFSNFLGFLEKSKIPNFGRIDRNGTVSIQGNVEKSRFDNCRKPAVNRIAQQPGWSADRGTRVNLITHQGTQNGEAYYSWTRHNLGSVVPALWGHRSRKVYVVIST